MDLDLQPQLEEAVEAQGETVTKQMIVAPQSELMPAMSIELAIERKDRIVEFVSKIMRPGHDFGVIPGTQKRTLLKPGAERLASYFGLSFDPQILESVYDWTGVDHGGEPFFAFTVRCSLTRNQNFVGAADGHCNSFEKKYRWREGGRVCPRCGSTEIRRSKYESKEFYCWAKQGGCGAQFPPGSDEFKKFEAEQVQRVPNPDVADQVNTILKMAEKRAFIGAVLIAVNASQFFTVGEASDIPSDADAPQETREQVRDRLMEGGPAASRYEEPPPDEVTEFDYDQMVRAFREVRARLTGLRLEEGEAFYSATLHAAKLKDETSISTKQQGSEVWKILHAQAEQWASEKRAAQPEEPPTPIDSQHGRIPEIGKFRLALRKAQPRDTMGEAEYERILRECGASTAKSNDPIFSEKPELIATCIERLEQTLDLWTNPPPKDDTPKDDEKQEDLGF